MQKQRRGITLVALVITIIILLILAGITISLTIGQQGILRRAEEAGKNYIAAAEYENQQLTNFLKEADEIIDGIDDKKELPENALAKKVKIGDYVAYNPTAGVTDISILEYTSPIGTGMSHGNGYSEQTFKVTNSMKWRVLSKDETTGEVILISDIPIQTKEGVNFYLNGVVGYLYAEQELNEICKMYGYGKGANTLKTFTYKIGNGINEEVIGTIQGSGARSIKEEDINRITQYDPKTFFAESEGVTYRNGSSYMYDVCYPTRTTENGKSDGKKEQNYPFTGYWYHAYEYLTNTGSPEYEMLFLGNDMSYWLANRTILPYGEAPDLNVSYVLVGGKVWPGTMCRGMIDDVEDKYDHAPVRPIVYLKPDILTNEQDENGAWVISE